VFINGVLTIPNILDLAPAAAYSLRSFDSAADPNVVNVRRSSDSATSNFKASEVSDGTLTTWVGSGNDGHVTTWYDQGGTNHAAQATASSQPKIVDGGTLVSGIDFGAQSDALFLQKDPFTSLSYDSLSSFVVASFNGNSSVGSSPLGLNTSPRYYMPLTRPDGIYLSYSSLETLKLSDNTTEPTSLFSVVSGSSDTSAYFNGVSAGSVSSVAGNSTKIAIGYNTATAYHNGLINEIVIFNTDQSANRTGIEKNINDTYTIY
jgi:hypothetical protein